VIDGVHTVLCVVCPLGCGGEVVIENGLPTGMNGFSCAKGRAYAVEEAVAPKRMVTTTMRVRGGAMPLLPVVSDRPVPKERMMECVNLARGRTVDAPITAGAVVLENALGLGIDFLAARDVVVGG